MLICSIGLLSALSNLLLCLGVIMCFVSDHLKEAEWCGGGMLFSVAISYLCLSYMERHPAQFELNLRRAWFRCE
jgi:hypothetical protein